MSQRTSYRGIKTQNILAVVFLGLLFIPAEADCARQQGGICFYTISNTTDSVMRKADILIDEGDFSEAKLRDLMEQFREQYPEPNMLVMLFSKFEQYNKSQMGHAGVMLPSKNYAGGILIYRGNDQIIRYKRTSETDLLTIVVKGIDPFR